MPTAPLKPCSHPRCPNLGECPTHGRTAQRRADDLMIPSTPKAPRSAPLPDPPRGVAHLTLVPRLTLRGWQVTRKVAIERELARLRAEHAQALADTVRAEATREAEQAALGAPRTRAGRCPQCHGPMHLALGDDGARLCPRCRLGPA